MDRISRYIKFKVHQHRLVIIDVDSSELPITKICEE